MATRQVSIVCCMALLFGLASPAFGAQNRVNSLLDAITDVPGKNSSPSRSGSSSSSPGLFGTAPRRTGPKEPVAPTQPVAPVVTPLGPQQPLRQRSSPARQQAPQTVENPQGQPVVSPVQPAVKRPGAAAPARKTPTAVKPSRKPTAIKPGTAKPGAVQKKSHKNAVPQKTHGGKGKKSGASVRSSQEPEALLPR